MPAEIEMEVQIKERVVGFVRGKERKKGREREKYKSCSLSLKKGNNFDAVVRREARLPQLSFKAK